MKHPPRLAKLFLKFFSLHHHHALWGDIEEIFHDKMKEKGNIKARIWYWQQVGR